MQLYICISNNYPGYNYFIINKNIGNLFSTSLAAGPQYVYGLLSPVHLQHTILMLCCNAALHKLSVNKHGN